jgi:ribose 5-phosphate isomerase A
MSDITSPSAQELADWKRQAAEAAADLVESGMIVGLGSGSTALFATRRIAARLDEGSLRDIRALPTSSAVEAEARRLAIPLVPQENPPTVDLTIDGADELDPQWNMIKGGGGALLREKLVAQLSRREVIVIDETKLSPRLCTRCPLPVEVIPFGWGAQQKFLERLGAKVSRRLRKDGEPYVTDQANFILDCTLGPIANPVDLARTLEARSGIAAHGLFLGLVTDVMVAGPGGVRQLPRS